MARMKAKDVMTSLPLITVAPDTPVQKIAWVLAEHHISGVPVVDDSGKLVGVVSETDLLPKEAGDSLRPLFFLPWLFKGARAKITRLEGRTASDVMSSKMITAEEATPLQELALLMIRHQINRVPITRGDKLVGMVTRSDILKVFRPDEVLESLVRERITKGIGLSLGRLTVSVREGVVSISGRVELRSEAELIEAYVRGVDGIVDVDTSALSYEQDDLRGTLTPFGS